MNALNLLRNQYWSIRGALTFGLFLPVIWLSAVRAWAEDVGVPAVAAPAEKTAEKASAAGGPLPGYEQFIDEVLGLNFLEIPLWRIAAALVLLMMGVFLRTRLLDRLLAPFRMLAAKTKTQVDDDILAAVRRPLGWIINLVAIHFATLLLQLPEGLVATTTVLIKTLGTVCAAWMVFNIIDVAAKHMAELAKKTETDLDDHLVPLAKRVLRVILIFITTIMIIQQWGYDVTSLVAGLGIGGLAFALAAQSTLSNWFGSIMILTDRPFKVGDLVKSEHGDGTIEEIGLRSTKIRTFGRTLITVPNSDIATTAVENFSTLPVRQIKADLGLVYGTTQAQMEQVIADIRAMLAEHEDIDQSFFMVNFVGFGASSLDIFMHAFAKADTWHKWFDVRQDVFLKVMGIVEEAGTSFAFPSQSLYFETPLDMARPAAAAPPALSAPASKEHAAPTTP